MRSIFGAFIFSIAGAEDLLEGSGSGVVGAGEAGAAIGASLLS